MSNQLKIGVLGCADIAKRFLIPAINESSDFQLIGISSRSENKADKFAKIFNTNPFYDYNILLNSGLDAIYIPLPNALHFEWVKKALNQNIHVLVEKSLACSLEEVIELNQLAKNKELVLLENFQFRFHKQINFILNKINNDELGEINLFRSSFGFPPFKDSKNIRYVNSLGGGSLLDAGAYTLKVSQIFLGNDIFVDSANLFISKKFNVDINGSASLKQKNGNLISQVAFGFNHFYQNSIEIWGSKGKLTAQRIFTAGPGINATILLETADNKENFLLEKDNHFRNMLSHFSSLIRNPKLSILEYSDNINQARLINEVFEKSKLQN